MGTVTATLNDTASLGLSIVLKVLTGAAAPASQPGVIFQSAIASNPPQFNPTPTATGSWIYGTSVYGPNTAATVDANTTSDLNFAGTTVAMFSFRGTGTTTSGTAVLYGGSAPTATAGSFVQAEILKSGTLAEDASSPAAVTTNTAHSVTTAGFNPPPGSLLVAMVSGLDSVVSVSTITMSDTFGGLTWKPLATFNTAGNGISTIIVAQVPGYLSPRGAVRARTPQPYTQGRPGLTYGATVQPPAWTVLQSAGAPTASSTTGSATFGKNLSSGTKILCFVANNLAVTSVKDTAGNSLTQAYDAGSTWSPGNGHMSVYAMDTPAGDVGTKPTITVTVGSTSFFGVVIQEVSGLLAGTTGLIDGTTGTQLLTSLPNSTPIYSTSAANEYLVGFLGDDGSGLTGVTAATGYTVDPNSVFPTGDCDCVVAYKNSTGGAESCVFSATGGATGGSDHSVVLLAFKLAASGNPFGLPNTIASGRVAWNPGAPVRNPVAPSVAGPPVYPQGAIRAKVPVTQSDVAGSFNVMCPAPVPPTSVAIRRTFWSYGAPVRNPTAGPVFTQRTSPVRAHAILPSRGRVYSTPLVAVQVPVTGPPLHPQGTIRAKLPQQPLLRGRAYSNKGTPAQNPTAGPVFRQATSPVRARRPLPARGRVYSNPGTFTPPGIIGPPFYPFRSPVRVHPVLPPRGRVYGNKGAPVQNPNVVAVSGAISGPVRASLPANPRGRLSTTSGIPPVHAGPPFFPAVQAIRARLPQQPLRRGRATSNLGAPPRNPSQGPAVYPLQGEVRSQLPSLHPRAGRVYSSPGEPVQDATAGPQAYALQGPIRVRFPGPFLKGRASSNKGAPVQNPAAGPSFRQVPTPVQAKHPLPPRGRVAGNIGAPVQNPQPAGTGPAFFPIRFPARARVPQVAPRGRVYSNPGAPVKNPALGPVFRQVVHPVQPRIPQVFSKGRVYSNPGGPSVSIGPPVTPPHGPVAARRPLPPRGRAYSNPGGPSVSIGPAFRQAVHPVQARAPLPPRGRVYSNPGIQAPPVTAGPKAYPLHGPVQARRPLPPHGRVITGNPGAPARNPHQGAAFHSQPFPARTRIPQNAPRGRTASNPGGPVENIPFATLRFRTGTPYFQWDTEDPGFQWDTSSPGFQWATGDPEAG